VDFEVFRPELDKALAYSDGSKGGRLPFNPVLMFKILVIYTLNSLSDERTEYLINDRLSSYASLVCSFQMEGLKNLWLIRLACNFWHLTFWLTVLWVAFDLRFEQIGGRHPLDSYAVVLIRSRQRKRRML